MGGRLQRSRPAGNLRFEPAMYPLIDNRVLGWSGSPAWCVVESGLAWTFFCLSVNLLERSFALSLAHFLPGKAWLQKWSRRC